MSILFRSFWQQIGVGLMWFLILTGFGGCVYLATNSGPLVSLKDNTVIEVRAK